ncbi:Hypothetical protein BQ3484_448 [Cedratvirus A11]|uniref:Uncharacterized protein n=1 Tax=Cedratvirus A11 TaxID=1903266 RepID=A0A1M7XV09_9VIRU|nr:Hypothetical protein BQ3484_448 [Cedratvirus A11]SHO33516.1 Hypothetical protein BQ3484_448 [Cedratvirus A11]
MTGKKDPRYLDIHGQECDKFMREGVCEEAASRAAEVETYFILSSMWSGTACKDMIKRQAPNIPHIHLRDSSKPKMNKTKEELNTQLYQMRLKLKLAEYLAEGMPEKQAMKMAEIDARVESQIRTMKTDDEIYKDLHDMVYHTKLAKYLAQGMFEEQAIKIAEMDARVSMMEGEDPLLIVSEKVQEDPYIRLDGRERDMAFDPGSFIFSKPNPYTDM